MLKALTSWLATKAHLTVGVTLYAGYLPEKDKNGQPTPDTCVALRELGVERVNPRNTKRREKPVQVVTRGPSYFGASDEANRIFGLFANKIRPTGISGWDVRCTPGDAPQYLPTENSRGLHFFVFTVLVRAKQT